MAPQKALPVFCPLKGHREGTLPHFVYWKCTLGVMLSYFICNRGIQEGTFMACFAHHRSPVFCGCENNLLSGISPRTNQWGGRDNRNQQENQEKWNLMTIWPVFIGKTKCRSALKIFQSQHRPNRTLHPRTNSYIFRYEKSIKNTTMLIIFPLCFTQHRLKMHFNSVVILWLDCLPLEFFSQSTLYDSSTKCRITVLNTPKAARGEFTGGKTFPHHAARACVIENSSVFGSLACT